jgi:hypothetical protein
MNFTKYHDLKKQYIINITIQNINKNLIDITILNSKSNKFS